MLSSNLEIAVNLKNIIIIIVISICNQYNKYLKLSMVYLHDSSLTALSTFSTSNLTVVGVRDHAMQGMLRLEILSYFAKIEYSQRFY